MKMHCCSAPSLELQRRRRLRRLLSLPNETQDHDRDTHIFRVMMIMGSRSRLGKDIDRLCGVSRLI